MKSSSSAESTAPITRLGMLSNTVGWLLRSVNWPSSTLSAVKTEDKRDRLGRSRLIDSTSGIHVSRRSCSVPWALLALRNTKEPDPGRGDDHDGGEDRRRGKATSLLFEPFGLVDGDVHAAS